ncbi:ABC transporter ATP-binding protein [Haematomicrobium sanguinis]|uniref:ABC transporter ATP-binding protein n=1 Tax=Haematomicrobium sanguinis TaxID=479106 RepID=UPI00047C52EA|nr:ATP-binding cassette domain-containing protein [Haematomicrobium sanguinis]
MSGELAINTEGLGRSFRIRDTSAKLRRRKEIHAVSDLNLRVPVGTSLGYIGANGAGKSTTIKMLCGILVPSRGTARTLGLDPVPQRIDLTKRIGVVFGQRSQLWWDLPLTESFRILEAIHRLEPGRAKKRRTELVDRLGIGSFLDSPVRQLSLGQRMRGEVAAALQHEPELVILDEPTIGLDVLSKEQLRQFLIEERRERGTTLMLTTHDMDDVSRLCERIVVIDRGRQVFNGDLDTLIDSVGGKRIMTVDFEGPTPPIHPPAPIERREVQADGARQVFAFAPRQVSAAVVLQELGKHGQVRDISLAEPDIEDIVRTLYRSL